MPGELRKHMHIRRSYTTPDGYGELSGLLTDANESQLTCAGQPPPLQTHDFMRGLAHHIGLTALCL